MYETALTIHNYLRLAVLVIAAWTVLRAIGGWMGNRPWNALDRTLMLVLTILVDLQLVIGLLLHLVWSPVTKSAMSDMKGAMSDSTLRKWVVEHPVMMVAGIALVHAGKVLARKATSDNVRHRRIAIFVGIALVLFFVGTSWPWSPVPRPWLRFG